MLLSDSRLCRVIPTCSGAPKDAYATADADAVSVPNSTAGSACRDLFQDGVLQASHSAFV